MARSLDVVLEVTKIPTTLTLFNVHQFIDTEGVRGPAGYWYIFFEGQLTETATGNPIYNRKVTVWFTRPNGTVFYHSLFTRANGYYSEWELIWEGMGPSPVGTWTLYAEFLGDDTYEGCKEKSKTKTNAKNLQITPTLFIAGLLLALTLK